MLEMSPQVNLLLGSSKRDAALHREARPQAEELVGLSIDSKGENAIREDRQ